MRASPAASAGSGALAALPGRIGAALLACLVSMLLLACIGFLRPASAQQAVPALTGRIVDATGTLDAGRRAALEARLESIEKQHGSQVAVLLVPSTEPESIEAYAIRVAEQWKLGRADVDDGVVLVVAMRDRRMRIEVGYGLEGAIPDAIARRIIAEQMAPRFQAGDFAGGLEAAVESIGRAIAGEGLPAPVAGAARDGGEDTDWVSLLLFAAFAGFILTRMLGVVPGALVGGAGGGFLAVLAGASLFAGVASGLVLFFLLLLFGAVGGLGQVGPHTYRSGTPPIILPGGGRRGGGFGGGGFGGGGFRGGGGGFGGGGASGGW